MQIDNEVIKILSIKAEAFNAISIFMSENYKDLDVSNVAPEEAYLLGIIRVANGMVANLITGSVMNSEYDEDEEEEY